MIRVNQIKLPIGHTTEDLYQKTAKILRIKPEAILKLIIKKKSIDSRKKPDLYYVYSVSVDVNNEKDVLSKAKSRDVIPEKETCYCIPASGKEKMKDSPLIVGAGPAGLFAAYLLSKQGYHPVLIEQGKPVEERQADVERFWKDGVLNPDSNAIFGEGGAGTFSDGKLNTAIKDPTGRISYVLSVFCEFGAPESILYENKPHIGTDVLISVLKNMRSYLIEHGCEVLFMHRLIDLVIEDGSVRGAIIKDLKNDVHKQMNCSALILAPGHGARATFELMEKSRVILEPKLFAVGFRVEHPQEMINQFAYGNDYSNSLPASPYKVTSNFPGGRGVYSFCMCPGGYVVNASSEEDGTVVNGMSYSGRNGINANSAIIVSVNPNDFCGDSPLRGIDFQKNLERKTYERGCGRIPQQLFGDYKNKKLTTSFGDYDSTTKGATCFADLRGILNQSMEESFILGMEHFGKIIPGFDRNDAILSGTESRTSSPVRITRDENYESSLKGLYPCGEGAGYAGGITSAAIDGLKVAEAVISRFCND